MSQNDKRLGQGLSALFDHQNTVNATPDENNPFMWLSPRDLMPNPDQPRKVFEEESLKDLAESLRGQGMLQPILARPANEPGKWQIVAGERRWRASQMAGMEAVPVLIQKLNDGDAMIAAMMENIHRADLNPIERAKGLNAIKDALAITQSDLANLMGLQRSTLTNILRLLNLSKEAQDDLAAGRMNMGQAKSLISLPPEAAEELRKKILETNMSARAAEMAAQAWQQAKCFPWVKPDTSRSRQRNPDIIRLARQIGQTLNCRAQINGSSEKGRINLSYDTNEQLFELLEKLGLSLSPE